MRIVSKMKVLKTKKVILKLKSRTYSSTVTKVKILKVMKRRQKRLKIGSLIRRFSAVSGSVLSVFFYPNLKEYVAKQETHASYCQKCNYKTKTEGKLTNHVAKHERHASFCDNCNFETKL